jgi:hypothetical protein
MDEYERLLKWMHDHEVVYIEVKHVRDRLHPKHRHSLPYFAVLIYTPETENLLVALGDEPDDEAMRQWQAAFGKDFVAARARPDGESFVITGLDGTDLTGAALACGRMPDHA